MGFDATKYSNDYNGKNYDRFNIMLPKGAKQIVQQYCQQKGISINRLVSDCLLWEIGAKDWKDVINGQDSDQK